jgi:integrase
VLDAAIRAVLRPREDRDVGRACSPSRGPTRSARRSRRRAARSASQRGRRTTCATGASPCCTQGWSWARIGEYVGQRDIKTTADIYTHVLVDETEVAYADLLAEAA